MSDNHDVSKLDDLIITLIDSIKGYDHSAEKAEAARYKGFFLEMAQDRRTAVSRLQDASRALGGTPADYGSASGTLHRRVEDLRVALGARLASCSRLTAVRRSCAISRKKPL